MLIPKDKNNGLEIGNGNDRGATHHLRTRPHSTDKLFIFGKGLSINKKLLNQYFPIIHNRSNKTLFILLAIIYANPLRTINGLVTVGLSNADTINKNILLLMDLGFVQQENKPRRVIPFDAYTIDKVYRITAKGVKALSAITGY